MILSLDELTSHLQAIADRNDTLSSEALWIKFGSERERGDRTVDYRTADGNTLVHMYLDRNGAIVGIEIFP
jgi:hypothetical protein